MHSAHERGSGQGGGRDSQAGRHVTGRGSRLRFSAPRGSSPGPGAAPRPAGWPPRGRHHTGRAGRPRSPLRSARSRHLRGPRGHWVGLDWPWPLGPGPLRPGREGGDHRPPREAVGGSLGIFWYNAHTPRGPQGSSLAVPLVSLGWGSHRGQADRAGRGPEDPCRGQAPWPFCLGAGPGLGRTARSDPGGRQGAPVTGSQWGARGPSGRGGQGRARQHSPCFSWTWPLPLSCAIRLLSMGPGGSRTDPARAQPRCPAGRDPSPPPLGPSAQQMGPGLQV